MRQMNSGSRGGAEGAEKRGKTSEEISGAIIDTAIDIHKNLGPGLLESVYETVLAHELEGRGYTVERQKAIDFTYKGHRFDEGFRCDLLVENLIVVELKSVEKMNPVHAKQLLTYLKLMNLEVGLLVNFGQETLRDGLKRIVNNYHPSAPSRLRVNSSFLSSAGDPLFVAGDQGGEG